MIFKINGWLNKLLSFIEHNCVIGKLTEQSGIMCCCILEHSFGESSKPGHEKSWSIDIVPNNNFSASE
jgi:hypothetical protein